VQKEKVMVSQSTPVTLLTISQMKNSSTKTSECALCQVVPLAATRMTTRVITQSTTSWVAVSMTLTMKRNLTLMYSTISRQTV
jgi:hypothetical protein